MKRFVALITLVCMIVGIVYSLAEERPLISRGDYDENVIVLHQKLIALGMFPLRAESPWGPQSEYVLKLLQEYMGREQTGIVQNQEEMERILTVDHYIGKNLAIGTSSEWSEWITPETNANNRMYNVAYVILNEKNVGDSYTCSLEIEFKDVKATSLDSEEEKFSFRSQGTVDESWDYGNIWNNKLVKLTEAPENGVYKYTATNKITEKNVNAERFNLGFRCDYWNAGSFRVRNVKVEKGVTATE